MAISEDVRKVMMAGLGALSTVADKTQETIDTLAKKGEETLAHGQVLNERLRHKVNQVMRDAKPDKDEILDALDHMTTEEIEEIKAKLKSKEPDGKQ